MQRIYFLAYLSFLFLILCAKMAYCKRSYHMLETESEDFSEYEEEDSYYEDDSDGGYYEFDDEYWRILKKYSLIIEFFCFIYNIWKE